MSRNTRPPLHDFPRPQRASVIDERTSRDRYFINIDTLHGASASGNVRFSRRDNADRVANAINKAFEDEGRLWDGNREGWDD